jgi:murein DD-endopeptidase MepM/ murein hydrolase activator NlpD
MIRRFKNYAPPVKAFAKAASVFAIAGLTLTGCATRKVFIRYPVKQGDTLVSVSNRFHVRPSELMALNDITGRWSLRPGMQLRIPFKGQRLTKEPADIAAERARLSDRAFATGMQASDGTPYSTSNRPLSRQAKAVLGRSLVYVGALSWPVDRASGKVSSRFGQRGMFSFHEGVDFAVPEGTKVFAAHAGTVVYSGNGLRGYGNLVAVRGTDGLVTIYGHNSVNKVRRGQRVKKGNVIALSGNTGKSTGPHLHFETRVVNSSRKLQAVDPLAFY